MAFQSTNGGRVTRLVLILLLAGAALVECFDAAGWALWSGLMARVEAEPSTACRDVLSTALLAVPAASAWGWTVAAGPMLREAGECGQNAVRRVAGALQRWTPVDPRGWTLGARAELVAGRIEVGTDLLRESLRRNPTSPYLQRLMALLKMRAGDYDGALELLADAEGLAPGYRVPVVEVLPGDDLWIELEGLRRRASLYPRHREDALLTLANKLWSRGRRDEARQLLEPLKDRPSVIMTKAAWALEEGNAPEAAQLAQGVASGTGYPRSVRSRAYSMLARALEAEGLTDQGLEAARKAVRLDPDSPEPYVALSRLARRRGDTKAALQYMRSAWGVAPSDIRVLLEVAATAEAAGAVSDARLALQRAEQLAPERLDVGVRLADFLLRHGNYMRAAIVLSRQLERHPMDPRLIALAARLQGKTSSRH